MNAETVNYEAVLADLEAKREALDNAIAAIRMLVGQGQGVGLPTERGYSDPTSIPSDAFFQMSIPDAIRKYLGIAKRPRSIRDISEALEHGGLTTQSKSLYNTTATALSRMSGKEGGVVKVNNDWGLMEWYPGRKVRATTAKGEVENQQPAAANDYPGHTEKAEVG